MSLLKLLLVIILIVLLVSYITPHKHVNLERFVTEEEHYYPDLKVNPLTTKVDFKFQFMANWEILHNETVISSGGDTGDNIISGQVRLMRYYDKLRIRIRPGQNKGAFIGVISSDGKTYVTNSNNFKISGQEVEGDGQGLGKFSGGKFLGCFKDQDGVSYLGNNGTVNCNTYCKNKNSMWSPPKGSSCASGTVKGVIDSKWCKNLVGYGGGLESCQCKAATGPTGRALVNYKPDVRSISDCHKAAVAGRQIYYGLQNGGECRIGSNYAKYGSLPAQSCGQRCDVDGSEHSYCGSPYANVVYSTVQPPSIQSFSDLQIGRIRSKSLPSSSEWIIGQQNTLPNSWPDGVWEFVWVNIHPPKIPFCNYPEYVQFQPSACKDPTNSFTCWKTVLPNYQVDTTKCKDLYEASPNLDSDANFQILNRAYRKATKYDKGPSGGPLEEYLQTMEATYTAACKVLAELSDKSFDEGLCQKRTRVERSDLRRACQQMPEGERLSANDVNSNWQQCQPGTLECLELKDQCEARNHCFSEKMKYGPRCYLPPKMNKYEGLNSPDFYSAIQKASSITTIPKFQRRASSANFLAKKIQLINLARTVEFNTGDNQQCGCQEDIYNPNSLKYYFF